MPDLNRALKNWVVSYFGQGNFFLQVSSPNNLNGAQAQDSSESSIPFR